jgi:uncharacterized protein
MAFITRRKLRILYIKLVKQSGTPESISRGVAIGFFTGFFIPLGGQMIIATGLAFIFRARKIPAIACTWITNPWTVPIIYPFQCYLGAKLTGGDLTFTVINQLIKTFMEERTLESFTNMGSEVLVPFFVGGAFLGFLSAFGFYFASYGMIISHGKRVEAKLAKRLAKLAEKHDE